MPTPPLPHPVALVTGAGSGIGRAVALMLAREGYHLALVGRDPAKLNRVRHEIGPDRALPIPADLADPDACTSVIESASRDAGRLDVLINNAGWSPLTPIPDMDPATARRIVEVNALAPIWLTLAACRQFARQPRTPRSPCIVNVSSRAAFDPFPGLGIYGCAKAAVNTLARAIATESPGVRAFAVAPGAVETDLLRSLFPTDVLPSERCLSPDDVARVILDCVLGAYDHDNGRTIEVPSP